MSIVTSVLQKIKQQDGSYVIMLPINTTDEVFVDIESNFRLTQYLQSLEELIEENKLASLDKNLEIVMNLSNNITKPAMVGNIYCIDLSNQEYVNLIEGGFIEGKIFI